MNIFKSFQNLAYRAKGRHAGELLKFFEIELLGKYASTYCYHHPSHVLIELTTRCNLRCSYCNQSDESWQKTYGHQDMPFELYEKIIPQLAGSKVLLLYNIGEPLLYKHDIYKAIALARQYIPQVRITSNGLLWSAEVAKKLAQAGLTQMNVSIDSPDPDVMQRNRGADLEKIEENLRIFGQNCTIPVETWSVINAVDAESLERLPAWASQFPAIKSLYFQLQNGVDGSIVEGKSTLIDKPDFLELQTIVAAECKKYGLRSNIASLPFYPEGFHEKQAAGICKAPFTQLISINVGGKLAPCCSYATVDLGNVVEEGFTGVWNGKKMRAWRHDMLTQKYCSYCSEWCGYKQAHTIGNIPIKVVNK